MFFFFNIITNFPFLSLLIGILLFLGFNQIGEFIFYSKSLKKIVSGISDLKYQYTTFGLNISLIFLFPISLFYNNANYIIFFYAIILVILGLYKCIFILLNFNLKYSVSKYNFDEILGISLILAFFLLSLSPITHADALDYHSYVAKYILTKGSYPTNLDNILNVISGSGEVLIALGYSVGTEQISNLVQFAGLLSLIGILKKKGSYDNISILLLLSIPVLVFFISSSKPQFFALCNNLLIIKLLISSKIKLLSLSKYKMTFILLSSIFLFNSINIKFSFILSSFIIALLIFYISYKIKYLFNSFLVFSISFIIIICPFIFWKYNYYGGSIFSYFLSPLPIHLPGIEMLKEYLINYKREDINSIFNLIIPKNLGQLTNILGINFLLLISLMYLKKYKFITISIFIFYFIIIYRYGQLSARFLAEPVICLIILQSNFDKIKYSKFINFIKIPVRLQSMLTLSLVLYGVITLTSGSFSKSLRSNTLNKYADGYSLFEWVNNEIDKKSVVLSMHRSVGIRGYNTLSSNFINFIDIDSEKEFNYFANIIKKNKPDYLLVLFKPDNTKIFQNCIDRLHSKKKDVGFIATRNPFNKGTSYDAYIYKLKDFEKTNCLKSNFKKD